MDEDNIPDDEQRLREWFREYGPPALDASHHVDRQWWSREPPRPRRRLREAAWAVAAVAALLLLVRVVPGVGRVASTTTPVARPPVIAFSASPSPPGPSGQRGGPVTRIASPKAFPATRTFPPLPRLHIFEVKYYVVAGVRQGGAWSYPISVDTPAGTSSAWSVLSFPLAVNETHHKELFEVGVIPASYTP